MKLPALPAWSRPRARFVAVVLAVAGVAAGLAGAPSAEGSDRPRPTSAHASGRSSARALLPPDYFRIVRSWHTPEPGKKAPVDPSGRPMLVLNAMHLKERATLTAKTDEGGFSAADIARATHVLRQPGTNLEHPAEERTLSLLYRIQRRFGAQEIRVISGYRAPIPGKTNHGNHGRGRAVDFVVPGAEDEDVARFARQLGFAGVGIYPVSSFIHVDVRPRSYFWRDTSGPGHKNRERGILPDLARRSDESALARGEGPPPPYVLPGSQTATPVQDDEDED